MRSNPRTTRRDFLASSAALAAGSLACQPDAGDGSAAPAGAGANAAADITAGTLAEAEKLHGVTYTAEERDELLQSIGGQVAGVLQLRDVPRELSLQPAITFDPRLPGVSYPEQADRIEMSDGAAGALPDAEADIAYAAVREQAHWIRTGRLTSRRLTEIYLSRIERLAPGLYCYITVTADQALAQADESDRELAAGRYRGELHGIPYGIKDCFDTAGIPTTWGAIPFRDQVPDRDARIVTMLREAGAVLLGKLATASLANGYRWYGGKVRNPWNTEEHAGGSSAGPGSATAAGLCSFSIGTDSLGSILNPADQCGIVGLRATFGRVPTEGAMPLTPASTGSGPSPVASRTRCPSWPRSTDPIRHRRPPSPWVSNTTPASIPLRSAWDIHRTGSARSGSVPEPPCRSPTHTRAHSTRSANWASSWSRWSCRRSPTRR